MKAVALSELQPGESATVRGFERGQQSKSYRQKLLAMGLTPNTQFEVVRRAPMGDPVQIRVRNFHLSLRQAEASLLIIERA